MTRWGVLLLVSYVVLGLNSRIPTSKAITLSIGLTALIVVVVLGKTLA